MQDEQTLIQSLADSGCDAETSARICRLYRAGYVDNAIRSLRCFRCVLMDELHRSQARVDCLDYLVHRLQKEASRKPITK